VLSSVANDVIMRTGAASAVGARRAKNVIMIIAGLWRYGDWQHVATGCNALVILKKFVSVDKIRRCLQTCLSRASSLVVEDVRSDGERNWIMAVK